MSLDIRQTSEGTFFKVKTIPNAQKSGLCGEHAGMLKVRVAAQPEKGKANAELCSFLAGIFKTAKSSVKVVKGESAREKTILAEGIKKDEILRVLEGKNAGTEKKDR
ncbi:MAG TPA: DUF167 domain-containing protein [Candidatus Goldiibacteriota bacterium]|nr:DUF167 domain-containing protein [Candidatus Goldiibacteriota bacterium]